MKDHDDSNLTGEGAESSLGSFGAAAAEGSPGAVPGARRFQAPRASGLVVDRLLGVGSTCTVWLARRGPGQTPHWQLVTGEAPAEFALKVRRTGGGARQPTRSALDELAALRSLDHAHLVRAHGVVETSHGLGLLLEPFRAGTLRTLVSAAGELTLGELVTVLTPIGSALASLHRHGVVHGDVSPGNILLAPSGRPALGDLADAQVLGMSRGNTGAAGFLAPERAAEHAASQAPSAHRARERGAELAPEADVYSLAAVAWWSLTGVAPAPQHRRAPLQSLRPELPRTLIALLEAALVDAPPSRPHAQDFAVELFRCGRPAPLRLERIVDDDVVPDLPTLTEPEPGQAGARGRARPLVVGATLAAAAVAGATWWAGPDWWPESGAPNPAEQPDGLSRTVQDPSGGAAENTAPADPSATAGEPKPDPEAAALLSAEDPEHAVESIAQLRMDALRALDPELVDSYTVAGSPARLADQTLVSTLADHGGFRGRALEIRIEGPPHAPGGLSEAAVRLTAEVRAVADGGDVIETQHVVLVLERHEGQWRLHTVYEAPSAGQNAK